MTWEKGWFCIVFWKITTVGKISPLSQKIRLDVGGWKCKCDIVLFSAETFCDDNQARQRWEQETQDVVYKEGKGKCLRSHDIRQGNNFSCSFWLWEVEETWNIVYKKGKGKYLRIHNFRKE